jgi:curved DNA-binding protein CbpA
MWKEMLCTPGQQKVIEKTGFYFYTHLSGKTIKDYYKILDLPPQASQKEIKKNFRRLALQYHPDVNPGNKYAQAWYHEIKEAYETLCDADLRDAYLQQRWLLKSQGKKYENSIPLTPDFILQHINKIDEQVTQMDHFRMGHAHLQKLLLAALPDEYIDALKSYQDGNINRSIVLTMLHAMDPLEHKYIRPVLQHLQKLQRDDAFIEKAIADYKRQRDRQQLWEKYQGLVFFFVSILLCLTIYLLSR